MAVVLGDPMTWCVCLGVLFAQLVVQSLMVKWWHLQTRITLDVMDNLSTIDNAKETTRNIFANLALVSALMMTIAFTMLFPADHLEQGGSTYIHHAYIAAVMWSGLQSVRAMLESVVNLIYTEALKGSDVIRFLIFAPGSIGGPIVSIGCSTSSMFIACTLWLLDMYSVAAAVGFALFAAECAYTLVRFAKKRSKFSTDRRDEDSKRNWEWAEKDDQSPPRHIKDKCDADEIDLMRRRGKAARDYDDGKKGSRPFLSSKTLDRNRSLSLMTAAHETRHESTTPTSTGQIPDVADEQLDSRV